MKAEVVNEAVRQLFFIQQESFPEVALSSPSILSSLGYGYINTYCADIVKEYEHEPLTSMYIKDLVSEVASAIILKLSQPKNDVHSMLAMLFELRCLAKKD